MVNIAKLVANIAKLVINIAKSIANIAKSAVNIAKPIINITKFAINIIIFIAQQKFDIIKILLMLAILKIYKAYIKRHLVVFI